MANNIELIILLHTIVVCCVIRD